jgi:hypothetical protein
MKLSPKVSMAVGPIATFSRFLIDRDAPRHTSHTHLEETHGTVSFALSTVCFPIHPFKRSVLQGGSSRPKPPVPAVRRAHLQSTIAQVQEEIRSSPEELRRRTTRNRSPPILLFQPHLSTDPDRRKPPLPPWPRRCSRRTCAGRAAPRLLPRPPHAAHSRRRARQRPRRRFPMSTTMRRS